MSYYECKRCYYKTKLKHDMVRHINRKIKCSRNIISYQTNEINITDKELDDRSLTIIKINQKEHENIIFEHIIIPEKEIPVFKEPPIIKEEPPVVKENDNKDCVCNICNKIFVKRSNLIRHMNRNCHQNSGTTHINNITNNTQHNTQNNTTNNTIIILNINKPLPFDNDWDVSKISFDKRILLFLSQLKYTKTLEQILENESNLNVIMDKNTNKSMIYKNENEAFKELSLEELTNLTMEKLHKHLTLFHEETKKNNKYLFEESVLVKEREVLDNKLNEFKTNKDIQKNVEKLIGDIFNSKKEETVKLYKDLHYANDLSIKGY